MRSVILVLVTLAGLVASSAGVQAQQSNRSYLPIFRQDPPPATFNLRVMRVTNGRNGQAGCVNPLTPAAALQGAICPLPGDYISLVAGNPSSIALGGRQGDASDAAWEGDESEFSLIEPTEVIADADVIEIRVPGYVEDAGLFTAPGSNYTAIKLTYTESAVSAAQSGPSIHDMVDFATIMSKIIRGGVHFDLDMPGNVRFYDRYYGSPKTTVDCMATHGVWSPEPDQINIVAAPPHMIVLVRGEFDDEPLAQCMGVSRWVKAADLMTIPAAANLKMAVDARRGGTITPFSWVTDARGTVYAFWSIATGTLAYYGYKVLNASVPNPAMWLYIPNEFLDVTCATVADVKTCLIQEGDPGQ